MKSYVSSANRTLGATVAIVAAVALPVVTRSFDAGTMLASLTGASLLGAVFASYAPRRLATPRRQPARVSSTATALPVRFLPVVASVRA